MESVVLVLVFFFQIAVTVVDPCGLFIQLESLDVCVLPVDGPLLRPFLEEGVSRETAGAILLVGHYFV